MGRRRGTSAFPVARIKKMMQSDDDVGKISTATPILVAKALECMMEYFLKEAAEIAHSRNTKTVTPTHLKLCVMQNDSFDFLRHVLKGVSVEDSRKRGRSPVGRGRGRRVRKRVDGGRGFKVDKGDLGKGDLGKAVVVNEPVPEHVAVAVEGRKDDEEDDYDDDDEQPTQQTVDEHPKDDTDDSPATQNEAQSQTPGRMSVSALLS